MHCTVNFYSYPCGSVTSQFNLVVGTIIKVWKVMGVKL